VEYRQKRVPLKHARASVPYYGPDLFPHTGPVAMNRTFGSGRFTIPEGAFFKTPLGIIQKLAALTAKRALVFILPMTIDVYHRLNPIVFPCHASIVAKHEEYLLTTSFQLGKPKKNMQRHLCTARYILSFTESLVFWSIKISFRGGCQ
jgi:hypothetical protein